MKKTTIAVLCLVLILSTVLCACMAEQGEKPSADEGNNAESNISPNISDINSSEQSAQQSGESSEGFETTSDDTTEDADPSYTYGDYTYKLTNGVARLVEYTGTKAELSLPSELEGHTLTAIEGGAFNGCDKITRLTISDSVDNIADGALSGCTALVYLRLGSGVAVFNPSDLSELASLSEISVSNANSAFSSEYGVLYNGDKTAVLLCPRALKADNIKLPTSVALIEQYAFAECSSLKKVQLSEGCQLSEFSFFHCVSLESVVLANGLAAIPEKCFFGCVKLKDITIPEGVTEIGRLAFFGCVALSTASIPSTVTLIGDDVFKCCSVLKRISVKGEYATLWYTETGKGFIN